MRPSAPLSAVIAAVVLLLAPALATAQDATLGLAGTPPAGVATELLLEAALPAANLPPAGEAWVAFQRSTLPPGGAQDYPYGGPGDSVFAEVVLQGTLAVTSEGPLVIVRDAGAQEEVPPNTEAVLGPGDVAIWLDNEAVSLRRNPGDVPAVELGVGFYSTVAPSTPPPPEGTLPADAQYEDFAALSPDEWGETGLAGGAVRARIERVTVAPGASLPPSAEADPVLRYVEAGELEWAVELPGAAATPAVRPLRLRAGQGLPWTPLAEGRLVVLRSVGDEPLVMLVLTLGPAEAAGTPAP